MDIKKQYKTDASLEEGGVWVDFDTYQLKIARLRNNRSKHALDKIQIAYKKNMPEDIWCGFLAEYVLLDWDGIEEDGKTLPHSYENAKRVLLEYPDFKAEVFEVSLARQAFLETERTEDKESLKKSSPGS